MAIHIRILSWALIFILRLRFPPGESLVNILPVFEFLLKENVRSILLLLIDVDVECVISSLTKPFATCSVLAHSKHLVCFTTNLYWCGEEQIRECDSCMKCLLSFLRGVGSFFFLILTSSKLTDLKKFVPQLDNVPSNCTQSQP